MLPVPTDSPNPIKFSDLINPAPNSWRTKLRFNLIFFSGSIKLGILFYPSIICNSF